MTAKYDPSKMKQRLKSVIEERGLSMREVSLGSGNSESYVAGIISSPRDPHLGKLFNVCEYLGLSTTWLLYGFDVPDGADEILQLIAERPELAASVATLLRAQYGATHPQVDHQ